MRPLASVVGTRCTRCTPLSVLEPAVHALALDERRDFLRAAHARVAQVQDLEAPTLALAVAGVHPEEVGGEQRGFVAAGARPDFKHDVLDVVRILRNEKDLQLGQERVAPDVERLQLLVGELAHVGVLDELFGRGDLRGDVLVLAKLLDERLHLRQLFGVRTELHRVGLDGRVGHLRHQLFVTRFCSGQLVQHVQPVGIPVRRELVSGIRPARATRQRRAAGTRLHRRG